MKNDHPKVNFGKTGLLLINLGTPESTKLWDIRKYLKEFLSDQRVIEVKNVSELLVVLWLPAVKFKISVFLIDLGIV